MNLFIMLAQGFFFILGGWYFFEMIASGNQDRKAIGEEDKSECERINKAEKISLGTPLTEKARPSSFDEIIGQEKAVKALRVALFGQSPQNIIIYGPPGVGKTAAARIALKEAKLSDGTPFLPDAGFIEIDATTLRYDERSFADPLMGSVHDPIYQGAGAYGSGGIPQPKPGAVTKAHGGVLFIDEIGELSPTQLNKLLKVLEDRRVYFESAYYSKNNKNIPHYIHSIFRNGLPADFRLIGATTRSPSEIPDALRSRCCEIFFLPLGYSHIMQIVKNAAKRLCMHIEKDAAELLCMYISNGRDAVRIVETVASLCRLEKRNVIKKSDVRWAIVNGRFEKKRNDTPNIFPKKQPPKRSSNEKIIDMSSYIK